MLTRMLMLLLIPCTCLFANDFVTSAIRSLLDSFLEDDDDQEDMIVPTSHTIDLPSGSLSYTAIAGILPQFYKKKKVGELFFTAYLKEHEEEGEEDPTRPITFIFNGGPGGSSLSMHIGGLGPKRLLLPEEGQKMLPPYKMIDNPETLLVESDLVFIDPMGTGYSSSTKEWFEKYCYGVEGDLNSFAEFIRVFCGHFDKWNHPKYLLGASYGTSRACGLAERLAWGGIHLNGIILMSCAIDFTTLSGERDNALSDCLLVPSLAATAWHHGRIMQDKTLKEVVAFARRFINEQYAPVVFQPSRLNGAETNTFHQNLANLIGLPLDTIRRCGSRIDETTYVTEFMAPERKNIGAMDSRYCGDISTINREFYEDPSYRDLAPAFYPSYMNYLQTDLNVRIRSIAYEDFSVEAFHFWDWNTYDSPGLPNFLQRLRRTLISNPTMNIFIGSGYYDLRTPFGAMEYSIDHLDLPTKYQKNFQMEYYEAGHGFIFDRDCLKKFSQDVKQFYAKHSALARNALPEDDIPK